MSKPVVPDNVVSLAAAAIRHEAGVPKRMTMLRSPAESLVAPPRMTMLRVVALDDVETT